MANVDLYDSFYFARPSSGLSLCLAPERGALGRRCRRSKGAGHRIG